MLPRNKLFTSRAARSILGNSKPPLLCTALASSGRTKRSSLVFSRADLLTWLVNSKYVETFWENSIMQQLFISVIYYNLRGGNTRSVSEITASK